MKLAAVALVAAASMATANAQIAACATANFKPWVSSTDVTQCSKDTAPYAQFPIYFGNATTYALFCKSAACEKVVYNTLAARPAAGDCTYKVENKTVNFFEAVVDATVKACGYTITSAPSTAPPTTAPPTTAPTTAPPTTAPPTPTTPAPTRPACA